jgi:predicted N-acetyltransferase YhbS
MDLQYCHIYKPTRKDMSNNIIVRDGGRIVSCVGIFPMTFVCGDARLSVGGIGGVSTEPRYRGQGLMTKLLSESISVMGRRGYDVSILWGDRLRYNRFGWENAGRQYAFTIDRRHVSLDKATDGQIRPYSSSPADLREIARVHEKKEFHVRRTRAQHRVAFNRHPYETWVWKKDKAFAYMTIRGKTQDRKLREFGGDASGLDGLLGFLFKKYRLQSLSGTVPFCRSPYLPFVLERSSEWGVRFIGMVKILNLHSLLGKFSGQIHKKCRGLGLEGSLTLEMKDSGQVASLHFGRTVAVSDRKAEPTIRLSDTEMVRLLLGTVPPSHAFALRKSLSYLDSLFPLDFYVGWLDAV